MPWEWVPLLAGPLGALLGAGATYSLSRSRLGVTVDRIAISPSRNAHNLPIAINEALKQAVAEFPGQLPLVVTHTAPECKYVAFLDGLRRQTEDQAVVLGNARRSCAYLRQLASEGQFERLVAAYRHHHAYLWGWATGGTLRGVALFADDNWKPPPDVERVAGKYAIFEASDRIEVGVPGTALEFSWDKSKSERQWQAVKRVAQRTALAFHCHARQDLADYFSGIRTSLEAAMEQLEKITSLVGAELDKLARIQVDFLVSNTGRVGISIGSEGIISVFLKDYPVGDDSPAVGQPLGIVEVPVRMARKDVRLDAGNLTPDAAITESRYDQGHPILVQAGETLRLLATSEKLVAEHEYGAVLLDAYRSAERNMQLSLIRFRQPRVYRRRNSGAVSVVKSRKVLFRDLRLNSLLKAGR